VTNTLRVPQPLDLRRGVATARLLGSEVGGRAVELAPGFALLAEPAYLAVRHGGEVINGLSVILRDNPWRGGEGEDASAVATLCQDHPFGGDSRLGAIVAAIAEREGRGPGEVARDWFGRYGQLVLAPVVRLYADLGLCLEPHQQNVVLELADGWPARAVYRDAQGVFHRQAAHDDLVAAGPDDLAAGEEAVLPETLADQRLAYYALLNNALGVVNALGVAGHDEIALLADLKALLERERERGGRYPLTLLDRALDAQTWPCKANLTTRMHDTNELPGDIAGNASYVELLNPLHGVRDRPA
jgi:siderophore synthetase component